MKEIYIIEGLGGIGKSSLVSALGEQGFFVVKEISDEIPSTTRVQEFTFDEEHARRVNAWFLETEQERIRRTKNQSGIVFMDRGIYSQLAYNFARDHVTGAHGLLYVLREIKELEIKGIELAHPMIYLCCSVEYSREAIIQRNKREQREKIDKGNMAYVPAFMLKMQEAYSVIEKALGENALHIGLPEMRGNEIECIQAWIKKRKRKVKIRELEEVLI